MPASLSTKSKYQRTHFDGQINHKNRQKLFANAERYSTWVNNTTIYLLDLHQMNIIGKKASARQTVNEYLIVRKSFSSTQQCLIHWSFVDELVVSDRDGSDERWAHSLSSLHQNWASVSLTRTSSNDWQIRSAVRRIQCRSQRRGKMWFPWCDNLTSEQLCSMTFIHRHEKTGKQKWEF